MTPIYLFVSPTRPRCRECPQAFWRDYRGSDFHRPATSARYANIYCFLLTPARGNGFQRQFTEFEAR